MNSFPCQNLQIAKDRFIKLQREDGYVSITEVGLCKGRFEFIETILIPREQLVNLANFLLAADKKENE